MPWVSDKQRRWGNSEAGKEALGAEKVKEFNEATKLQKASKAMKGEK